MFVCEYCGSAVYWDRDALLAAGKKAALSEGFTRLYRGAAGALRGRRFVAEGRIRYSFGRGFWDEWYLRYEGGGDAWLTEDNHELCIETLVPDAMPPVGEFSRLTVNGVEFRVEERGLAECIGAEGEVPCLAVPGTRYAYVDGSSPDGKHSVGIEYETEAGVVFVGNWLAAEDLSLDDEGEDWK
jgi:hypothetical protein